MARMVVPLTDRKIKAAKPKDKPYRLFDGYGLFVEIRKTGKKIFRYKEKNKTITLGEYPLVTLLQAREWVQNMRRENLGIISKKFSIVCEEFFEKKESELSEKHFRGQQRRVAMYMQHISNKRVAEIAKRDIVAIVLGAKTNELKKRVFILLRQIMKFAYARDYVASNVCDKIDLNELVVKQEIKHHRAITNENDFKELIKMIWMLDNIHDHVRLGLRFLVLTALRSGNVRGLMWEWVDLEGRIIEFPVEQMKNKRAFRLPLTDTLVGILKESGVKNNGLVFSSYSEPNRKISDMTFNMILRRLGVNNHTTHGFRSSFSTICYKHQRQHGFSSEVIEAQLSHSVGSAVARAYQRGDFLEERLELLKWWEDFVIKQ